MGLFLISYETRNDEEAVKNMKKSKQNKIRVFVVKLKFIAVVLNLCAVKLCQVCLTIFQNLTIVCKNYFCLDTVL